MASSKTASRTADAFPDLRFVSAASLIKVGDLYSAEGNLGSAKSLYHEVAGDKSSDMMEYRALAEKRLGELKIAPPRDLVLL